MCSTKLRINRKAVLLLLLFVFSTLLIKPVHILIHDHKANEVSNLLSVHNKDCEICTFHFSTFIPSSTTELEPIQQQYLGLIKTKVVSIDIEILRYVLSVRAPPTL